MVKMGIALVFVMPMMVYAGSVYKCETAAGVVYQSSPCPVGAKKLAAACVNTDQYYSGGGGVVKFDGEDCETKNRKIQAENKKIEDEQKINDTKRRDAFIKATMPKSYNASFNDCVVNSDDVSSLADGRVINIVDTVDLKVTKFCSVYGSTIITCSRYTGKMVIKPSGNNGCD